MVRQCRLPRSVRAHDRRVAQGRSAGVTTAAARIRIPAERAGADRRALGSASDFRATPR
jgi:hypothetical protein